MRRRSLLGRSALLSVLGTHGLRAPDVLAAPTPIPPLHFPRDLGSHPDHRIEWWYLTGELWAERQRFGFQVTFFRARIDANQGLDSALAARHLMFAHTALTDVGAGRLASDQRVARSSGDAASDTARGLAWASERDTDVHIGPWSLTRSPEGRYRTSVQAREFTLQLDALARQPLLLQGDAGWSRKGPEPRHYSRYYTEPQLQVSGQLQRGSAKPLAVTGTAWLDHEWSNALLPEQAEGWDWLGLNLDDGSALTVFRLRDAAQGAVWAGGSLRRGLAPVAADASTSAKGAGQAPRGAVGPVQVFRPEDVAFQPLRHWRSPVSGANYPVEWAVRAGGVDYRVRAVVDAQELDSRGSTGAWYWEGLSDVFRVSVPGTEERVGRGYLEMTGYAGRLKLER